MAFSVSPSIIINEIDIPSSTPAISGDRAAIAGVFAWGPVGIPVFVTSELELVNTFGKPSNMNGETFFVAADFLSYSAGLFVNRIDNGAQTASGTNFTAKYPGEMGNSLGVSFISPTRFTVDIFNIGEISGQFEIGSKIQTFFTAEELDNTVVVGDILRVGNPSVGYQNLRVARAPVKSFDTTTSTHTATIEFDRPYALASSAASSISVVKHWGFHSTVGRAPISNRVHIVVYDADGLISGTPGNPIEVYTDVSLEEGVRGDSGESLYYKDLLRYSKYIQAEDSQTLSSTAVGGDERMTGGSPGQSESTVDFAAVATGYDVFRNAEEFDISFILQGKAIGGENQTGIANYIVDNISESRKDCRAFLSPSYEASVQAATPSDKITQILSYRGSVSPSSYWHMDSGYKQRYDKYNDVYRWVPLNGDMAGLYSRVDPWETAAGFNKGIVKNVVKLAFNPNKDQRDLLYAAYVNPVITQVGYGTILYGDKTGVGRTSSFDRQNVRGLFIYVEKSFATASKNILFEFNDEFTQNRFKNMVEPTLRMIQGRRGLQDFRVVADGTVNTPDIVDANRFVAKIYIKPSRSINFIELNFISTPTGISFDEIVGQF